MFFVGLNGLVSLLLPAIGLYLLWRGVVALEGIKAALRDRNRSGE